jgi:hypothetical protein
MEVNRIQVMATLVEEEHPSHSTGQKPDVALGEGATFSGAIPGDFNYFDEGDVFTVPKKLEVRKTHIRGINGWYDAEYIYVETESGKTVKLFPGTFTKHAVVYNEPNSVTSMPIGTGEIVRASGTAVELYKSKSSVQEGMEALRGKKIKVSKMTPVRTLRYGTYSLRTTMVGTFDLIEK